MKKRLNSLVMIILYCTISTAANAQSDSIFIPHNFDSLNTIYGKHKVFLKEFKEASLIALTYFPELIDEKITFKYASINSSARTTVTFLSLFLRDYRHYIIYINDDRRRTGMLPSSLSYEDRVALIAHELAHVLDFKKRSFLRMGFWGLRYLFIKQRTKIEKEADEVVIKRGLGDELYHLTDFILNHSTANKRYLKIKRNRYLLPREILALTGKYKK